MQNTSRAVVQNLTGVAALSRTHLVQIVYGIDSKHRWVQAAELRVPCSGSTDTFTDSLNVS